MLDDLAAQVARAAAAAPELRVAVSLRDLDTGEHHAAGDAGEFGSASLVKVMIAARLLVDGAMDADTARLAHAMVSASDDDAANVLWERTGAGALEPWVERHYGLPGLGSPNRIPGRWGNTHFTAGGFSALYGALRADPAVWPWLSAALHAIAPTASDGTDQVFGLLAVDSTAGVKQGWANGSSDDAGNAVVHSTGVTHDDRYAVVVLTEGRGNVGGCDRRGLHAGQAATVTHIVRVLLG